MAFGRFYPLRQIVLVLIVIAAAIMLILLANALPLLTRDLTLPSIITAGPYPPQFQGTASGIEVWKWTDGSVECMLFKSSAGIDSVCRSLPEPSPTPMLKVPTESST
jgi:hypothetical protein